jgi:hypothetical protein
VVFGVLPQPDYSFVKHRALAVQAHVGSQLSLCWDSVQETPSPGRSPQQMLPRIDAQPSVWSWYAVTISPFSTAQDACMTHAAPVLLIRSSARMLLLLFALSTDQCRMEARHGLCAIMYVCASVRKLLAGMCASRSVGKLS